MAPVVAGEAAPTALGVGLAGVEPLPAQLGDHTLIVVCGSTGSGDEVLSSPASATLIEWLRRHGGNGRPLACVCSGALMAAAAGLLDGRRCTTHHSLLDDLRRLAPGAEVLDRSEEHTSELQSLMRISYAVFCLKKKNNT